KAAKTEKLAREKSFLQCCVEEGRPGSARNGFGKIFEQSAGPAQTAPESTRRHKYNSRIRVALRQLSSRLQTMCRLKALLYRQSYLHHAKWIVIRQLVELA